MPPMTYGDVKETTKVFWRVTFSSDPIALDLDVGDILVFEGTPPTGTITKYRKGAADHPRWADNCFLTSMGQDGRVDGRHFSMFPMFIDISARITTGGKATHSGTVFFPAPGTTGTWMADEGP